MCRHCLDPNTDKPPIKRYLFLTVSQRKLNSDCILGCFDKSLFILSDAMMVLWLGVFEKGFDGT